MPDTARSPDAAWSTPLLQELAASGPVGAMAADYLRSHSIRISATRQSSGARWTLDRRIQLNSIYRNQSLERPYALSLLVHEVEHLRQGPITALSVYGELRAWKAQFKYLLALPTARPLGKAAVIDELLGLPEGFNRSSLGRARRLMRSYAGPT